jgi:uncharacterized protein YndB with AHSA1/START domain
MTGPNVSLSIVRRIGASAEQLFRAWTDPKLMARWFAPEPYRVVDVEAEARIGGRYKIVVADATSEHITTGEYVELVPNRRIVKTWSYRGPLPEFGGAPTLVRVDLRELEPKLTELTLTHAQLAGDPARRGAHQGWLSCLDALEDAHAPEHRFRTARTVKASVDEAYAAWTEPALMRHWFGTVVEADVRVGGTYRIENHEADGQIFKHKGEYRVLEPGRRIVQTFVFDGDGFPDYAHEYSDEVITITFRAIGPRRTEVTLTNEWNGKGLTDEERENLKRGWNEWLDRYEAGLSRGFG